MRYQFKTRDHPEANGRQARPGDECYRVWFPLDGGGELTILCGRETFENFTQVVRAWDADQSAE